VVAETATDTRHVALLADGGGICEVRTRASTDKRKFPFILYAVPPSGADDLAAEVRRAAELWDDAGTADAMMVLVSSGGVYAENGGGTVTEESPTAGDSTRVAKMLAAEQAALEVGACVVRLAGLYSLDAGPHSYWLRTGTIRGRPDGRINMIHYEDAASLCVAALQRTRQRSNVPGMALFLGVDDHVMTREGIVAATARAKAFRGKDMPVFVAEPGAIVRGKDVSLEGKVYDASRTRRALAWGPRYPSLDGFMNAH